jgi:hypothetical protein
LTPIDNSSHGLTQAPVWCADTLRTRAFPWRNTLRIKGLPRPEAGNRVYYDDLVSGFGCRVTAAGARAFVLNYRRRGDGVEHRYTIGSYPEWTVAGAREEAKTLRRSIDSGGDPVGDLRAQRDAPTVNELCDRFVAEYLPRKRPSTQRAYGQQIASEVRPALGRLKVASVTFADIDRIHRAITKRERKYLANRVIALLSSMFAMAIKWRMRTDNPCKGVERNDEAKRKRYLTGAELERLSAALSVADQDSADIFRLLLLTGARTGEVLSARWADIDLEAGTWTKPGATTKQRTEHVVPLNAPARQLLAIPNMFFRVVVKAIASISRERGSESARRRRSPGFGSTTCAIPTRRSSPAPASVCMRSAPCSVIPSRKPRTDTRIYSMITCAKRPSASVKW